MSGSGPLNPYVLQVGVKTAPTTKEKQEIDRKRKALAEARQRAAEREETNPYGALGEELEEEPVAAGRDTVAPPNAYAVEESAAGSDEEERQALREAEEAAKEVQDADPYSVDSGTHHEAPDTESYSAGSEPYTAAKEVQEQAQQAALEEHGEPVEGSDEPKSIHVQIQEASQHLSVDDRAIYSKLKHLSSLIAFFAKSRIYGHLKRYFIYEYTQVSLMKLAASPGVISENKGQPYTLSKAAKQFIRTFLHMHDEQLHCVIIAYLKLYYGVINEADAFRALLFALERELRVEWKASEAWDVAMLHEVFLQHRALRQGIGHDTSLKQFTVLLALHEGLKDLHLKIIWIEWIANWKNVMKLFFPGKGPLAWTYNHRDGNLKLFTPTQIDHLLKSPTTDETFRSIPQLKQSYLQFCFGPHVKVINGKFEEERFEPEKQGIYERLDKTQYFRKFEQISVLEFQNKLNLAGITELTRRIKELDKPLLDIQNQEVPSAPLQSTGADSASSNAGADSASSSAGADSASSSAGADVAATSNSAPPRWTGWQNIHNQSILQLPTIENIMNLPARWNYYDVMGLQATEFLNKIKLTQENIQEIKTKFKMLVLQWHPDKLSNDNIYIVQKQLQDIPVLKQYENAKNFQEFEVSLYRRIFILVKLANETLLDDTKRKPHNKDIQYYQKKQEIPEWQKDENEAIKKEIQITLKEFFETNKNKIVDDTVDDGVYDDIKAREINDDEEVRKWQWEIYGLQKEIVFKQREIDTLKNSFRFNNNVFQACQCAAHPGQHYSTARIGTIDMKTLIDTPIVTKYDMKSVKIIKPGILWEISKVNDDELCCRNMDPRTLARIKETPGWSGKNLVFVDTDIFFTTSSSTDSNSKNCVLWTIDKKDQYPFSTRTFVNFGVKTKNVIFALIWKTRNQWLVKLQNLKEGILAGKQPPEDYNRSFGFFGDPIATKNLVRNICSWIEYVANEYKNWWSHDNNQNFPDKNLHAKFNGRMARIVYALFKNEVIWNVFDNYLTEFMGEKIANFRLHATYSRKGTSRKGDNFSPKIFMGDQVDLFIKNFKTDAPGGSDLISNTILNYWISSLKIGPHPYNYAIDKEKANNNEYIGNLITNLQKVWEKEQGCYGGSTSTFTYAWKPSRMCIIPWAKLSPAKRTTVARNNIMILAGHYANEQLFAKIFNHSGEILDKKKVLNLNADLQTIVDIIITEIGMETYTKPSDIAPKSWEFDEQNVLSDTSNVSNKKFYKTDKHLLTWKDFFDTHAQITTDQFKKFEILLTQTKHHFGDIWWTFLQPNNDDWNYFIQIKKLWASESVSKNNVQLTNAQEFLTHVYCDMKSLTPSMIEALPIDSLTRHQLEQCYAGEFSTSNFETLENDLWTESAEFLDVALKLTNQYAQELKQIELNFVIDDLKTEINNMEDEEEDKIKLQTLLKKLESGSVPVTDTAMQNPICQKIIQSKSEPIVKQLKAKLTNTYSAYFNRSTDQRDALILPSAGGGGDGGGGGGGGFDFEFVPSEPEEENNDNNGGHRENHGADGREYHKHKRMDEDATAAAAAKEGYVDPFAPKEPRPADYRPPDRPYGWVPQNAQGRSRRGHGTGEKDENGFEKVGAEMNNTNIYILKPPHAVTAFISGRRVSALAPEAEHETRLARDYGLDGHDAGSSCAKYAV